MISRWGIWWRWTVSWAIKSAVLAFVGFQGFHFLWKTWDAFCVHLWEGFGENHVGNGSIALGGWRWSEISVGGWGALVVVELLLMGCCLRWLWLRIAWQRKKPLKSEIAVSVKPDTPILCQEDDTLGRGAYVETLGDIILDGVGFAGNHAKFIGVYGGWGEGKTSVRNLLEMHLLKRVGKHGIVFIDFCPWKYGESCDLRLKLCEKLEVAVRRIHKGTPAHVFSLLVKLATFKSPERISGILGEFLDLFRSVWFSAVVKEEELLESVERELREMSTKTRIVVTVDDLDRVTPDEAARVIRFLKSGGDLPNLVYLVLADETYLANAVAGAVGIPPERAQEEGREYLRKIVGLRCPLPQISKPRLAAHFDGEVAKLATAHGLEWRDDTHACEWAAERLKTLRDEKLLLNEFSAVLAVLKRRAGGKKRLGVHLGDLLALTAVRCHEPVFFTHLMECCEAVWETYSPLNKVIGKTGLSAERMEAHGLQFLRTGGRDWISSFLSERLGIGLLESDSVSHESKRYGLLGTSDVEDMAACRLASKFHFASYFHLDNETTSVLEEGLTEFKRSVLNGKIPGELLSDLEKRELWNQLLDSLTGSTDWPPVTACECYVRTLVHMMAMPRQRYGETDSAGRAIYRCLALYAKNMKNGMFSPPVSPFPTYKSLRAVWTAAFLKVVEEENDVVLTVHFIDYDYSNHPDGKANELALFTDDEYQRLRKGYLKRIVPFQKDGKLMGHPEFVSLFLRWMNEAEDDRARQEFRSALSGELCNVDSTLQILGCFVNRDYFVEVLGVYPLDIGSLEKAFGNDGFKQMAATLEPLSKDEGPKGKIARLLKWILEAKAKGEPYDEPAQDKHLLEEIKRAGEHQPLATIQQPTSILRHEEHGNEENPGTSNG
ncbi:MAG: hypothetical protein J6Y19_09490 [Kiritimatiellae bacterium]|nr:hypothetical protein [Kiritimatiellia bacterium]